MNKYQKALVDIRCDTHDFIDNNYDEAFKMVYNKQFNTLQELVNQTKQPTLEEVKKEWEELGYEWRILNDYPHMIHLVNDDDEPKWILVIKINTRSKKYWKRWGDLSVEPFTFEEHQLLTKTFRALGWFE